MHMKRNFLISLPLFLLFASFASADFAPSEWTLMKSIEGLPRMSPGTYVKVDLDREVSFHAARTLGDLRVIADDGTETPYQLLVEDERVRSEYRPSTLGDLSSQGERTMFIIDLGASGVLSDRLHITSDSRNYKRVVSVYASDERIPLEAAGWRLLSDKGYIYNFFDQRSGFDAGSGEVSYPETSARYLKVVVGGGEGERVTVRSAEVYRESRKERNESVVAAQAVVTENAERKTTEILVDLGSSGLPTHEIILSTVEKKDFDRRALIQTSDDGRAWSSVGEGFVFSLETPAFTGESLSLAYPERSARYVRVLILNEDDRAISWSTEAKLLSVNRSIVFRPEIGRSYSLYYGAEKKSAPRYDLARFFQYIEGVDLPHATLGYERANPEHLAPAPPPIPLTERHPNAFTAVLVLFVAVMSFFLISHLKKLKHSERGENGPEARR